MNTVSSLRIYIFKHFPFTQRFALRFQYTGYQVKWNNGPSEPILFDNSEIRKMDMTDDDDYDEDDVDEAGNVILIESEDDGSGGSLRAPGSLHADGSTSDAGGDRKMYECDICFRKVASSYNLKRHMMIHSGKYRAPEDHSQCRRSNKNHFSEF